MKPFENHIKAVLIFFCIYLLSLSVETFRGDWVGYDKSDSLILNKKSGVIYNMKQLKDHLDYGIITQAQYNQKIQKWRNLYNRMF